MIVLLTSAWSAPVDYRVSFDERSSHYIQVTAHMKVEGTSTDVFLPRWIPGSYLLREFARNLERMEVEGPNVRGSVGGPLPPSVQKVGTNRWRVDHPGQDEVTLTYAVYAHEESVRGNWVDDDFAVLNGTGLFVAPVGHTGGAVVTISRPDVWKDSVFQASVGSKGELRFPTLDALYDTPIVLGNPAVHTFDVDDVPHRVAHFPRTRGWEGDHVTKDIEKIVTAQKAFWGELPYDGYTFLNWTGQSRGGLEHSDSTLMMIPADTIDDDEAYDDWLGLVSHELFHAWNGKRLRPAPLGPFDYEKEVHTTDLWIVEGLTSYYDDLLLMRAGLLTPDAYLARLSKNFERVRRAPGRRIQSLSAASHDAWIKFYRPDANSRNSRISYYLKGAAVGFMLDARIRQETKGKKSLDDVMRLARARFSGVRGYEPHEFREVVNEVAGVSLDQALADWVDRTEELDPADALAHFGLERTLPPPERKRWLGVDVDDHVVRYVHAEGPAHGRLQVGDEVLAIDGRRAGADPDLRGVTAGQRVDVLVSRRGRVQKVAIVMEEQPHPFELRIAETKGVTARRRAQWMGSLKP